MVDFIGQGKLLSFALWLINFYLYRYAPEAKESNRPAQPSRGHGQQRGERHCRRRSRAPEDDWRREVERVRSPEIKEAKNRAELSGGPCPPASSKAVRDTGVQNQAGLPPLSRFIWYIQHDHRRRRSTGRLLRTKAELRRKVAGNVTSYCIVRRVWFVIVCTKHWEKYSEYCGIVL